MAGSERSATPESSMSCMSVEQERDSYKEKVEHLKLLIKQYQQDLQSHKIRKEGVGTVSKLLQESKLENMSLQRKIKTLETAIRNLQSRLTSNGLSGNINIEEMDFFMHGTSKQVLDNLAKENSRLRTLLKGASLDPEDIEKLQQTSKAQLTHIEKLQEEVSSHVARVMDLESVLKSSDKEKDREISRLRSEVKEMRDNCRTREVLCSTLTEEAQNLRQQLHEVALHCQQMAQRLEENNRENEKKAKTDNFTKQDSDSHTEVLRLRDENTELRAQLEEVTTMNHRWQAYNHNMEIRMQELMEEMEQMKAYSVPPERTESINRALEEAKNKLRSLEQHKQLLEIELKQKKELIVLQSHEAEKLRAELDNHQQDSRLNSNAETIEALKAQIQICTEDFESERRDREKAQAKVSQLEIDLEQLRRERDALCRNRQQHVNVEQHFLTNQGIYNDFNLSPTANQPSPYDTQLAARGPRGPASIERLNEVDSKTPTADDLIHIPTSDNRQLSDTGSLAPTNTPSTNPDSRVRSDSDLDLGLSVTVPALNDLDDEKVESEERRIGGSRKNSQVLTCPKCGKEFVSEEHTDLLEHLELCCD